MNYFLIAFAFCSTGLIRAVEPVKLEIKITAIGDPRGGKLQSDSIGCAAVRFTNRTEGKLSVLTSPRPLGKGRVDNWKNASYIAPKEGDEWEILYDVPKVVIEFLDQNGKVVHRDKSIQMGPIEDLEPRDSDSVPIFFSTPTRAGVYTLRLLFDNTVMSKPSGMNGHDGIPENSITASEKISIVTVSVIPTTPDADRSDTAQRKLMKRK